MTEELILLFSSNWETLYAQNAIDGIAHPKGSIVQFRYRTSWIGENLLKQLESEDALKTKTVLCVFVDRTIHSDICITVPTRYGTLRKAECYGDVWHLYFTVEEYFDWVGFSKHVQRTVNPQFTEDERDQLLLFAANFFRRVLAAGLNKGKMPGDALNGPPDTWATICRPEEFRFNGGSLFFLGSETNADSDWEELISVLHLLPYFENTVFFRIKEGHRIDEEFDFLNELLQPFGLPERILKPKLTKVAISQVSYMLSGYKIERCHPHQLTIVVASGRPLSPVVKNYDLQIEYESLIFVGKKQSIPIGAKNDVHKILLFPVFGAADVLTTVKIAIGKRDLGSSNLSEPDKKGVEISASLEMMEFGEYQTNAGKKWLDADDLIWSRERNAARGQNIKISRARPEGSAPPGPSLSILFKSSHSRRYLRIGGVLLISGVFLNLQLTEIELKSFSAVLPRIFTEGFRYLGIHSSSLLVVLKLLGIYALFQAFVLTTRKLPSTKT